MDVDIALNGWTSARARIQVAENELALALVDYHRQASMCARDRLVRAMEFRARARNEVLAIVREIQRDGLY